jgi:hypothetical protein
MAKTSVASLLRDGRIETVPADVPAGWARLEESKIHLNSSSALAKSDPTMAYVVLYDAARKAVTALMLATGYRATNRPGAHQAVALYAQAVLTGAPTLPHVRAFDRMRQVRNRSEYEHQPITDLLLTADLAHATGIVAAVEAVMPPKAASP